jgi:hypothetical protein
LIGPFVPVKTKQEVNSRMKILGFCPTARLEVEVVDALVNQVGVQFFDLMFTYDNPHVAERELLRNCVIAYAKMRRIAVQEGYDKVWIVESDTIPPKDALKKLLEVDADIVTGLYAHRHGLNRPNIMLPTANKNDFGPYSEWPDILANWGRVIEASGGCFGCLLIDKKTLADFDFEIDRASSPDTDFMTHCQQKGFKTKAHLGVVCGHKSPEGDIYWPDKNQGVRIERGNT